MKNYNKLFLILLCVIFAYNALYSKNVALIVWKDAITLNETLIGIKEYVYQNNHSINFDLYNINGDISKFNAYLTEINNPNKYDAVLSLGTGSLINGYNVIDKVPVVYAAVSNPYSIEGVSTKLSKPDNNITGLSYYVAMDKQIKFFSALKPNLSKVGILFNSFNEASPVEIPDAINVLNELNIDYIKFDVSFPLQPDIYEKPYIFKNKLMNLVKNHIIKSDVCAVIVPTNSEIIFYLQYIINEYFLPNDIIVFSFSSASIPRGALASLITCNIKNGKSAAKMLQDILFNDVKVNDIPFSFPSNPDRILNVKMMRKYNLKIDVHLLNIANLIIH